MNMTLPKYWRYFDAAAVVGILLIIAGAILGIYGAYSEIMKREFEVEIYLALIGIVLTIVGLATTVIVAVLGTRAIKAELLRKSE